HNEIGKCDGGEIAPARACECPAGLIHHRAPLCGREQRRLTGMGANRENQSISQPDGLVHDVEMPIGDGIERSRENCCARHGGGLACTPRGRKVGGRTPRWRMPTPLEAPSASSRGRGGPSNLCCFSYACRVF